MSTISLVRLAAGEPGESEALLEARRAMEVCNACRYCEGFCAVFPAMELHREFTGGTLNYLANLCHGCADCYYACQYAPPHAFGINVPESLARVRNESYAQYSWPRPLSEAFRRNGLVMAIGTAVAITVALLLAFLLQDARVMLGVHPVAPGQGFYRVVPESVMVAVAGATALFALLAFAMGFVNFWRDAGPTSSWRGPRPILAALRDAATLRYLGGGGQGCNDTDARFSNKRRALHHAMAYGFLLCFAATTVGAFYDEIMGWRAPYDLLSLPVLLGVAGGIGIVIGTLGMLWLKLKGDQEPRARELLGADTGLLVLLLLISASGLLLLLLRTTAAMGVVLTIHLGLVLAFFMTMPYSKFVHGFYRAGALLRHAAERLHA